MMNKLLIMLILVIGIMLSGCVDSNTYITEYDVLEYDLGEQYVIYIDGDEVNYISLYGDTANYDTVVKTSNRTRVEKHRTDTLAPMYIFYVNVEEVGTEIILERRDVDDNGQVVCGSDVTKYGETIAPLDGTPKCEDTFTFNIMEIE